MSSLKGSTYQKQIRDMNFKLFALGEKKSGDSLSHSNAILEKRNMYAQNFAAFLESQNIEGKLNQLMTSENMDRFLETRLAGLSVNTIENYLSGFNSLLRGFNESNISHGIDQHYFQDKWKEIKSSMPIMKQQQRGLSSPEILKQLSDIRHESSIIASLMYLQGYRIAEAMHIVQSPQKYISKLPNGDYKISGVAGKGGKIYQDKLISHTEFKNISNLQSIPSKSTFSRDLKKIDSNLRAHDFRYEHARNLFEKSIKESGYKQSLEIVSKALNHNRNEITKYYLGES